MKIKSIETLRVAIPVDADGPRGAATGAWDRVESLVVRVETAGGLVGWGEAFGHKVNPGTEAILHTMVGPWFLGKDAALAEALADQAQRAFHSFGRGGPVMYALSGIDIALWDIMAKRAGKPLFRLLSATDGELRCYASLLPYGGDRDAIARNSRKALDAGHGMIKLHETALPAFMAAREALPAEIPVALDVNCPWTVNEARAIARAIKGRGFEWLEEPVWPPENFTGLADVRREGVAIAGGENIGSLDEFRRAFDAKALDVAQPSVAKIGGVTGMRRAAALAAEYKLRVVPHCFYWGPGYLATAHIAASLPNRPMVETLFAAFAAKPHALWEPEKGSLVLPETPGLGFEPDLAVLERFMVSRHAVRAN